METRFQLKVDRGFVSFHHRVLNQKKQKFFIMNVIKEIESITSRELEAGIIGGITSGSWHDKYKKSAWVYVGGLSEELTEGDIICVMSQWGEIEDINLVREKGTNKSLGYAFVKYEDQRSTILAVDNFNGIRLLKRVLRCDHVEQYRLPKHIREREEEMLESNPSGDVDIGPGHAYKHKTLANEFDISRGQDVWAPVPESTASSSGPSDYARHGKRSPSRHNSDDSDEEAERKKEKKHKKEDKHKKHKKHKEQKEHRKHDDESDSMQNLKSNKDQSSSSIAREYVERDYGQSREDSSFDRREVSKSNAISGSNVPAFVPGANALSWRGRRDPAAHAPPSSGGNISGSSGKPRDQWQGDGYGGINRRR